MSRIVSVWLPHLALQRLKRERAALNGFAPLPDMPASTTDTFKSRTDTVTSASDTLVPDDRPFALVGSGARGLVLTAVNARCARDGLLPGLSLADARAIVPHLLTEPVAPEKDADALLALARWSSRYSPSLNVDGEDGLWLDITGVAHLFGGEQALLADLARRLARTGFTARLGLAETFGGAHALARFARSSPRIVSDGKIADALAPLPVEALRLHPDVAPLLRRLGLKRIGQLYDLPRTSLERRFHAKEAAQALLLRLDQALGRREEPRTPLLPAPDFVARSTFAEPLITHDCVIAGLEHLAGELCLTLARAGQGARRVILWVARSDGSSAAIEAGLSAPTRAAAHLVRLLKDKVETIDMGFGVDLMAIAALAIEPLRPSQTSLTGSAAPGPEALIDSLVNRLGRSAVRRLFPRASHIPELAQVSRSAFAGLPGWTDDAPVKPLRPLLLLARPEPLQVLAEIPEGPPARFTWRRLSRRVVKAEGPERIAPEWWRAFVSNSRSSSSPGLTGRSSNPGTLDNEGQRLLDARLRGHDNKETISKRPRDYYRIEDEDGCRYWVFREGLYQDSADELPCWFLHGVFA